MGKWLPMLAALCLFAAVTYKGYHASEQAANLTVKLAEVESKGRALDRGLMQKLNTLVPPPHSVVGVDALTGNRREYALGEFAVVYVLSTACPYSPLNVPLLNELHNAGVQVVGIVSSDPLRAVQLFAEQADSEFPLLVQTEGEAARMLPTRPIPLTAVWRDGELVAIWPGVLEDEQQDVLTTLGARFLRH